MTEKRFKIAEYPSDIEDTLTGKKYAMSSYGTHMEIICDLLNDLNDENEQLKQEMGDLGTAHAEEINKIEDKFDEEILKLEKENEQLKKVNKKLKEANDKLQFRTVDMLDYIKEKGTVTHQEMKEWWNTMMKGDLYDW